MSIIKWEPFESWDNFFEEMPSLPIKNLGRDLAVDLYEEKGDVVAKMNLPGVDPSKIDISIEDNLLRISGTHEEEKEKKEKHYYSKEIKKGSFERVISLPSPVSKDKVQAEYDKGVLRVVMPKTKGIESAKKINVKLKK